MIDMEVWRLPLSMGRASGYGLAALGIASLATSAQGKPALAAQNSTHDLKPANDVVADASTAAANCGTEILNTCTPRTPMRALSAKEVELLMGANSSTNGASSHGSCNAGGCNVTATLPPPVSIPPTPPSSSGGGGNSGGSGGPPIETPNSDVQNHLVKCAQVYGHTTSNSKFGNTNFTNDYGWTSNSLATGLPLVHTTTATDQAPATIPEGGSDWKITEASTFYDAPPFHTDLYKEAYTTPAVTVRDLVHEWYHQNNDVPGESDDQRRVNENNATAAGQAAYNAFNADSGAKCSG
jgi:hypothetical protein